MGYLPAWKAGLLTSVTSQVKIAVTVSSYGCCTLVKILLINNKNLLAYQINFNKLFLF